MTQKHTKQKVIEAASLLFYQKGFQGTSVRDIATEAAVNVSLISYYFKSKQGLLEHAVTSYYEEYIQIITDGLANSNSLQPLERLKKLIGSIIQYKQEHHQFSCFIHREMSFDSIFVREITVTYIAKENFHLREVLYQALPKNKHTQIEREYLLMQLKGMLVTPFVLQNEWKQELLDEYSEQKFIKHYVGLIHQWLDITVLTERRGEKAEFP